MKLTKYIPNPLKWSQKIKLIALILTIAAGGGGYYWYGQNSQSGEVTFSTSPAETMNLVNSITLSGTVEQSNLISVFTKASGVVKEVYVTDGQEVKAGDKLAEITLDSEGETNQASAWASYLNSKKSVETAQASQYSQQSNMFKQWGEFINLTNDSRFEDPDSSERELVEFSTVELDWLASEATYKLQSTAISAANASLSSSWKDYQLYQSTITAPADGTIVGINIAPGLSLSSSNDSQTVAQIKTEGTPVALFYATEIDIPNIKEGQEVILELDSVADQTFPGTVAAVDRVGTVNSNVTQYQVLIVFNEDDPTILTNMAVTADIVVEQKDNALVVPAAAVTEGRGGQTMVQVMVDGNPQPAQIEIGIETDTYVEIISGIEEGVEVVTGTSTTSEAESSDTEQRQSGGFGTSSFGGGNMGGGPPPGGGRQ